MRKFRKKVFYFLLPIILIGGLYEAMMNDMGETYSMHKVHDMQENNNKVLFMRQLLSQEFNFYKELGIKKYLPENLIIGSSRVMQFKSNYFTESFYNAGGLLQNKWDLNKFLKSDVGAKTIILGIDPWWFKNDNIQNCKSWIGAKEELVNSKDRYLGLLKMSSVISSFFKARINDNIGANAQIGNGGFRFDGSMKIPDERIFLLEKENKFIDTESPPIKKRIVNGLTLRFSLSKIDTSAFIESVKLISKRLKRRKENIVVYLPPFTNEASQALKAVDNQNEFELFINHYMEVILNKYEVPFISVESPQDYKLDDTYFIDGIHPSEVFVSLQLLRYSSLFSDQIDVSSLKNDLDTRFSNLVFNGVSEHLNEAAQFYSH